MTRRARINARPAIVVSIAAVAAITLGACSGGGGGALGSGDNSAGPTGTLVVAAPTAPWMPAFQSVIDAYEEETGNTVDLRELPPDGTLKSAELNDIQTGTGTFDVFTVNEPDMVQMMAGGLVQPLTEIDGSYALDPDILTYQDLPYWNAEAGVFNEDGVLTSVPINGNVMILMYRSDLYDKLGLDTPETWDELIANGKEIRDSGDARYGGAFRLQPNPGLPYITWDFQAIFTSQGGNWFADEGVDWTPTVDTEAGVAAATILREIAQLGPEATTTMGQSQTIALMQAGDAGQTYLTASAAAAMEDPDSSNIAGNVGYAALPADADGRSSASGVWSLAVPTGLDEERSKRALDFLSFVTSREAQTIFAENGGIPIRTDYDADGLSPEIKATLAAVAEAAPNAVGQLRYAFAPDMLQFSEPLLADIAAGNISPEDGMRQLQADLEQLVREKDLPTR